MMVKLKPMELKRKVRKVENQKDKYLSVLDAYTPDWYHVPYQTTLWYEDIIVSLCAFYDKIKSHLRSFIIGVKNIVEYIPIIYKDRDWDYEFILDIVKYKLERTRDRIKEDNIIVDTDKIVEEINTQIKLIDNYRNNNELYELSHQSLVKKIANAKTQENKDKYIKQYYTNMYKEEDRAWCKIFDYMKEHMRAWWD